MIIEFNILGIDTHILLYIIGNDENTDYLTVYLTEN